MGWATNYIQKLKLDETVSFRPRGNSMRGKIESGQLVTVEPLKNTTLEKGDIVLCKVKGREYIHLIKAIKGERYLIGNNRGGLNGWIGCNSIFGKCIKIEE
ncbi:S24 family peptidase [Patescibacteria group bacterium]|nr:S24 family peptidase [Patescibacteria group bacterium]MBU1721909.1 S24 family peptidase [Patescibacteria group bacterium]MBU1900859.1 S24 family peptidase [Patescibacteria group bacterium]